MAIRKKGKWRYGDCQADIRTELVRYGKSNYLPTEFADAKCSCGNTTFRLAMDEAQGVAVRTCPKCLVEHPMGDSDDFLSDAEFEMVLCLCDGDVFEITIGVALYDGSEDVKWLYIGCRCPSCNLAGCYGDWKNEFQDFRELLKRI